VLGEGEVLDGVVVELDVEPGFVEPGFVEPGFVELGFVVLVELELVVGPLCTGVPDVLTQGAPPGLFGEVGVIVGLDPGVVEFGVLAPGVV
jgi:hypothetical protein